MINKSVLNEIVSLCEIFAMGMENGEITKKTYTSNFKEPILLPFEDKYGKSPNLILQDELRNFYDSQLKQINEKLLIRSFGFWGNNIYSYVWTCVYYDFGKESLPASYSPQLYILANKMGLKFGFCYGHQISESDLLVQKAKSKAGLSMIYNLLQNDQELYFFNSSERDITARPELLFGENERIIVNSVNEIADNWSNKSLLIKEFVKDKIPVNIQDIILSTLVYLKDFYFSLLPNNEVAIKRNNNSNLNQIPFIYKSFHNTTKDANLLFSEKMTARLTASLLTKPFVILTGLSGSGKTKLANAFVKWICKSEAQYCLVPVGADWTNRDPILGYPNALDQSQYIKPDNGVVDLIINAHSNPNLPHFLILDEMNLSHVERYFADFLSAMESGGEISFHSGEKEKNGVPPSLTIPENLFVIGTINVDETTYMFSPKVLDRANVIEFRISNPEMEKFLGNPLKPNLKELTGKGSEMAESFMELARKSDFDKTSVNSINIKLIEFFSELKKTGAEYGYRSAYEIHRLIDQLTVIDPKLDENEKLDIAIMQKLLPKLHGSRRKLCPVLLTLGEFCVQLGKFKDIEKEIYSVENFDYIQEAVKFPLSLEKISRMYNGAVDNGFASYAEA